MLAATESAMDANTWNPRKTWRRFRLEAEAARNYPLSYAMYIGQTHRDRLLEEILPTLLYIKAVAILDDSLDLWLAANGHQLTKAYRDDLSGRLQYLGDRKLLPRVAGLHEIRRRRNDLAHSPGASTDWGTFERDIISIEESLLALGLVRTTPKLEYFCERSAVQQSTEPNVNFSRTFAYGVKEDGRPALEIKWTQKFLKE
jgi:hypothetical protein